MFAIGYLNPHIFPCSWSPQTDGGLRAPTVLLLYERVDFVPLNFDFNYGNNLCIIEINIVRFLEQG